jgi:hypothetical protein
MASSQCRRSAWRFSLSSRRSRRGSGSDPSGPPRRGVRSERTTRGGLSPPLASRPTLTRAPLPGSRTAVWSRPRQRAQIPTRERLAHTRSGMAIPGCATPAARGWKAWDDRAIWLRDGAALGTTQVFGAQPLQRCDIFDWYSIPTAACLGINRAGDCLRRKRTSKAPSVASRADYGADARVWGMRGQSEQESSRRFARLHIQGRHGTCAGRARVAAPT